MSCSSVKATGIPSTMVWQVWPDLWPLLERAYRRQEEKTDVLAGIVSRDLQCWAIYEKSVPVAGIVTRLWRDTTSGLLDCRIWLVGGARLSDWLSDFLKILIPWAKAEGCTSLSGAGRKGWTRIAAHLGCVRVADENGEPCWRLAI